ncbi:hypothetical protein GCK32_012201 [Trichostrongylus colubriformis]|uniref:Uncharacterized protein n=1 Tax=Trichostrongylus colubriformis TaxID=6319 RepID=A0AAN8F7K2_TRICO
MTRLLLLIYCTLCIAQNRDHRERRPHRPYIEPKYSRLTPFTNEENFPEPVFGMAHGLPYESMKKDIERELAEHFPIMERGRPDREDDTTRQTNGPPQITLPANGHDVNRETSGSLPSTSTEPDDQRTWAQTTSLTTTSLSSEKERVRKNDGYNDYRLTTEQLLTTQKLPCLGCAQVFPLVSSTMPPIARISSQTGVSPLMDKPSSPLLPSQHFALPLPNDQFNFRDIGENQGVGCRNRIRSPDFEPPSVSSTDSFLSPPSALSVPTVTVSFLFTTSHTPQKANISHPHQELSPASPNHNQLPGDL